MKSKAMLATGVVCAGLWLAGCGSDSSSPPTTPTPTPTPTPLTLSAPVAVSPIDGLLTNSLAPTLTLRAATGSDATAVVSYEIQVLTPANEVVYTRTVSGGPANGQATVSHQLDAPLTRWRTYRWRARAVSGSTTGAYSDTDGITATFATTRPNAATSNDEFRDFFFDLIAYKGVSPVYSATALSSMEPELNAAGVILAKDLAFMVRGRLYLPTGQANKYLRSVDVVNAVGAPWGWNYRGPTVCEFVCP